VLFRLYLTKPGHIVQAINVGLLLLVLIPEMSFIRLFFLIGIFLTASIAWAQDANNVKQPRILILLDGSSSMLQEWEGNNQRFKAAGDIIVKLIDSLYTVNDQVEFALRVYGHQHPAQENNCFDTKREVRFSKDNLTQMSLRLESLHPWGVSPIAYSLKEAAENDLIDPDKYNYSIVLITDGGESCGGDICAVVNELLNKKINFKPYIVSLVDYAPLKDQYSCLGKYLLVTKKSEIPNTVGTIVEAYRNMLTLTKIDQKLLQTVVVNTPSVLKTNIPSFKMAADTVYATITQPVEPKPQPKPVQQKPPVVVPPVKPAAPEKDLTDRTVTPILKDNISTLKLRDTRKTFQIIYVTGLFKQVTVPAYAVISPEPVEVPEPPKPTPPPPVKTLQPRANTTVAANIPAPPTPKEAPFTIERKESQETTLEVYFTNGKGKFYQTTPKVILKDPKTSKEVHKFFRTVNASGNPDPQKIPTGMYNLTVEGKSNVLVKNVEIKEGNQNKVMVKVNNGTLVFTYEGNPKRPVSEYYAIVNRRFEQGPTIRQACTQELEYEPGTYYVEVNTLPVHKRSLTLDFNSQYEMHIPEDGKVNFTNRNKVGKVSLYMPLGDKFLKFHELDVNGSANGQPLTIQPGVYEAHYKQNPNLPYAEETVKKFYIKSNQVTDLEL
jgi:hypothetical protein